MFPFPPARHNAKASWTRMRWQLAPFNLVRILVINLSYPALVGHRRMTRSVLFCAIDIHDRFIGHTSRMAEHGSTRESAGLAPCVFLRIVYLHIVHRAALRPTSHQLN